MTAASDTSIAVRLGTTEATGIPGFFVEAWDRAIDLHVISTNDRSRPPLISYWRGRDLAAVVLGRLYYKEELSARLGLAVGNPTSGMIGDNATFVKWIYRLRGIDGLTRLNGDFALAIFDIAQGEVIALRDPMGGYPLFWAQIGKMIALSTNMMPLLDHLGSRTLNPEYLLLSGSQSEICSEQCAFRGVRRLRPGMLLRIKLTELRVAQWSYWNWLEHIRIPASNDMEAVAEQYREVLSRAVAERLVGKTAAHLSGGMDSTAVALLANRLLAGRSGAHPLRTISLVYERLETLTRETAYIKAVLEQEWPLLDAQLITADQYLDFGSFAQPPPLEEPYPGLWRLSLDRVSIQAALRAEAATLLTGLGADELLDMQPLHVADLLRAGHIWRAWNAARDWAYAYHWNVWQVFFPFGLRNLAPAWMRLGAGHLLYNPSELAKKSEWFIPPWIKPEFARRYDLRGRAVEKAKRIYTSCRPTALSFAIDAITTKVGNVLVA